MRVAYFDCYSGISGDMTVGALIDAGADFDKIRAAVDSISIHGFALACDKVGKKDVQATKFRVRLDKNVQHPHRHLKHVVELIEAADLPDSVKADAIKIFEIIGHAEAKVHGTTIERVHFHEVGAIDSIVDIVSACYGLHLLGVEAVYASNIHVGAGTVKCAHGVMPVPAPATALILTGVPTYGGQVQGELTTPTGAAILKHFARGFGECPVMRVEAIGHGAGDKGLPDRANVVRVQVGELAEAAVRETSHATAVPGETIAVIEATIDDMPGELFPPLVEALLSAGAKDAFWTAAHGKKGRPACVVTALASPSDADRIAQVYFDNSSTLGVRIREERRLVRSREQRSVETPWGLVRVKVVPDAGAARQAAPEFEDCKSAAVKAGVPVKQVYEAALAAAVREEWVNG
ncbi:MAG: nickel pincer cofactor biosynthesis protein LarC [Candidatus Hydrogenedentota bacterium]